MIALVTGPRMQPPAQPFCTWALSGVQACKPSHSSSKSSSIGAAISLPTDPLRQSYNSELRQRWQVNNGLTATHGSEHQKQQPTFRDREAARLLSSSISACVSLEDMSQLRLEYGSSMDALHVAAMVARLPRACLKGYQARLVLPEEAKPLVDALLAEYELHLER